MSAQVQFGMLQRLKTQDFQGNNKAKNIQSEMTAQESVFDQAKLAYEKVEGQDGQGAQGTTGAFTQPNMSVDELETKMNEEQEKLEKLMASLSQEVDGAKSKSQGENDDEKNKVKPKEFGSLMA